MGHLRSWAGMLKGVGHGSVLTWGLVRSQLSMIFTNVYHDSQRLILDYLKKVLPLNIFEAFLCGCIFNKIAFCLGEKQGMLVNNECSSWSNRVGDFLVHVSVWDRRKEILYTNGSACTAQQNNPTPGCMVNGTECYDG